MSERFDEKQLEELSNKLFEIVKNPLTIQNCNSLGLLVRDELDKAYRRGFTAGFREGKNK